MSSFNWPSQSGSGSGVTSLNSLTGALSITAGSGISVTPSGSSLIIAVTGAGSGSVTSVGLSDGSMTPIFSITGSPVTTSGTLTFTLASQAQNKIFVGPTSGSGQPSFRSMILADMPSIASNTILGNNTGGTTTPSSLTVAQVNAMLPTFTSSLNGLVPASGGGTTSFLRSDGVWSIPGGSGGGIPQNLYYSGNVPNSSTNYWSHSTGGSYTNMTVVGTPVLNTYIDGGGFDALSPITTPTGNIPGIQFVAPRAGVVMIVMTILATATAAFQLVETNTNEVLGYSENFNSGYGMVTIVGYLSCSYNSTYQVVVKANGTTYIGNATTAAVSVPALSIQMNYIN